MASLLPASLSSLLKKSSLDDHEQILTECNTALKSSKGSDSGTQHIKIVALLKLDRYDEAVKFIENNIGAELRKTVGLEYAYALYKTGTDANLKKAAELAASIQSRGAQHIEAQVRYRLEESLSTSELYKRIRTRKVDAEEFDLRVNQGAIDAQAQWLGLSDPSTIRRPGREDLEAFETAYNAACGSIARAKYGEAEMLLKKAKELCKHSDDLSEQQKNDEILPISVQQLFVLISLGKTAEAEALATEIEAQEAADASTSKVAQNNVLLTKTTANPFLTRKMFHSTPRIPSSDKLFSYQHNPLKANESIIDLQNFKYDGMIRSTSQQLTSDSGKPLSSDILLASYFGAAAHAQNETGKAAIRNILPQLEKRPNDIGLILTLVQLYVINGDVTSAVELVERSFKRLEDSGAESDQETRFNPMLVGLLLSLYKHRRQKTGIKDELAKAAAYWTSRPNAPTSLLTAAGVSLLQSQSGEDANLASEIFSKLRHDRSGDRATVAGYVASHAGDDGAVTSADTDKLTAAEDLIRNIDIDALERAGISQSSNALTIAQLGRSKKRGAPDSGHAKPKRMRKSRLPKDYDETKKADPERWLPMKDRSYYRAPKAKKKGKRGGDDRTQGGAVDESLNVEAKAAAGPAVAAAAGGNNKKKKGKGKK
jgi:signal recognition particle subunit SRP72